MDERMCPFSGKVCNTDRCPLWDEDKGRCVFVSIADNLKSLNEIIEVIVDTIIFKH